MESMTAPFRLSVLDQSPIAAGATAATALANTLDLARTADALGYHRYWLAEHHASPGLAGAAPEALIGPVALATERIRVGSGGIMLPHYSPFKVAETFRLLGALAPGRIDLGLGRAPGSDQRTAYALQRDRSRRMPSDDFPEALVELLAYLDRGLPADHAFAPLQETLPGWAGELGLPYCIADFINSGAAPLANSYRAHFRPSPRCAEPRLMVAVWTIAATDRAEAERLAAPSRMMFAHLVRGELIAVPAVADALQWLAANPVPDPPRRTVLGDGAAVRAELEEVAALYGAEELMLVNILPDHAARRRSYKIVAETFGLPARV